MYIAFLTMQTTYVLYQIALREDFNQYKDIILPDTKEQR